MAEYSYGISSTPPVTNVESLATPLNPPRGSYAEWTEVRECGGGTTAGHGYPQVVWHFDYLTQDMVDQLRTFCSSKSAAVYISTRVSSMGTFATYSCIMHWPEDMLNFRVGPDTYENIDINFTKLVVYP